MGSSKASKTESKDRVSQTYRNAKTVLVSQESKGKTVCSNCKGEHRLMDCDSFRALSRFDRRKFVTSKHICFKCLSNHHVRKCKSSYRCLECSTKPHTLLHCNNDTGKLVNNISPEFSSNASGIIDTDKSISSSCGNVTVLDSPVTLNLNLTENSSALDNVLLATAWVYVLAENGRRVPARALIDQGAQSSFISEELFQNLKLFRKPVRVPISGIGEGKTFTCRSEVNFTLQPHFVSTFSCGVSAFVIPRITAYDPFTGRPTDWKHLQDLTLADPRFGHSERIDMLLDAQVHAQIVENGLRKGDSLHAPIAIKTLLGWIVSGPASSSAPKRSSLSANLQTSNDDLNVLLRKFWEVEEALTTSRWLTED